MDYIVYFRPAGTKELNLWKATADTPFEAVNAVKSHLYASGTRGVAMALIKGGKA